MAIEGFNYEEFANILSTQAEELLPSNFKDFQKKYVVNTIKNFSTLCGEAIYNDDKYKFTSEQAMLITQIIAEWSFHKSVDVIKSGILPEHWDGIMSKIAFTIFEIAKQMLIQNAPQEEIINVVEHHVKKTYQDALEELKSRDIINDEIFDKASSQSNIDEMMQQMQQDSSNASQSADAQVPGDNKVLKLASLALLLRQVSQDKVQSILNKFDPNDAQAVIQYMQMPDLEQRVDKGITMKCLQEIKTNLPAPKFISPDKVLSKISKVLAKSSIEKVNNLISNERSNVKSLVLKATEGECFDMPSKVANIIAQHLEERVV